MPRPAPTPRRSLTPLYVILGLVLLAGIALLVTQMSRSKGAGANAALANTVPLTPEQLQRVQGISRGRADAPITIYEFADYQCPHCAQFAALVEPVIFERLVDTGKARYVFYDFPVGFKWSWLSARAGRCGNEQGKFWELHALILARQQEWAFDNDPISKWSPLAQQVGMDVEKFEECVRSDRFQKEVTEHAQFGQALGVGGTPTLFVNGRKIETPSSYSRFEQQLREIVPSAFADAPAAAPAAPAGDAPAGTIGTSPAAPAGGATTP
ncbi:MAG TPA: DsbA family protein [Longimicrobium sp.]|nr:DsbA family protein [Longimicrobium sp.]